MNRSRAPFRSRLFWQTSFLIAAGLSSLGGCTRPTVGYCEADEQCDFGQYCSLPAHECIAGVVIRGEFSGGQVVPPTSSPASGSFMMVVNADSTSGSYTLSHNVTNATSIDLYQGMVGKAGVSTKKLTLDKSGTLALDPDLVRAMKVGNYSLQISSPQLPNGEVRAQLFSSNPEDTAETISLDGILSGEQQNPPNTSPGFGQVHMELDEATQNINYSYTWNGLMGTVNGVHIHAGGFNVDGPHICDLQGTTSASVNGTLSEADILACVTDSRRYLSEKHIWRIIMKSGDAYLNIHTDLFAKGEIRAQLLRSKALPFGVVLNPVSGSGAMAAGIAKFYVNADQSMMSFYLSTDKVQNVTGAVLTRGSGGPELKCDALTASGGADQSQGYCPILQTPGVSDIGVADLTGNNLFLRIKTTAHPTGELEAQLNLPHS